MVHTKEQLTFSVMEQGWNVSEIICTLPCLKLCCLEKCLSCSYPHTRGFLTKNEGHVSLKNPIDKLLESFAFSDSYLGISLLLVYGHQENREASDKSSSTFHFCVYPWLHETDASLMPRFLHIWNSGFTQLQRISLGGSYRKGLHASSKNGFQNQAPVMLIKHPHLETEFVKAVMGHCWIMRWTAGRLMVFSSNSGMVEPQMKFYSIKFSQICF